MAEILGLVRVRIDDAESKAKSMILKIKCEREDALQKAYNDVRKQRDRLVESLWWLPAFLRPKPYTLDEIKNLKTDGFPKCSAFYWVDSLNEKQENRCNDVLTLCMASADGFVFLSPGHCEAIGYGKT